MKSNKMIMMNEKGEFLIFWWNTKKLYIESKFGTVSTDQIDEVLTQVAHDLGQSHLFYVGDL